MNIEIRHAIQTYNSQKDIATSQNIPSANRGTGRRTAQAKTSKRKPTNNKRSLLRKMELRKYISEK